MADTRICSIDGCGKPHASRGWCIAHWYKWRRHGDPLGGRFSRGAPRKFLDASLLYKGTDCLIWPFSRNQNGYATISCPAPRCNIYVHRMVCELINGLPPTPKHKAAHNCGKGHLGCIAPSHLRWATQAENLKDMDVHGTRARGMMFSAAKLTEQDIREIRSLAGVISNRAIANHFGICNQHISRIIHRKRWDHVP